MEYFNATLNNSIDQLKIKPFECFTKIQEARPAHCSTLVNKELGYDAIIDIGGEDNCLKIKNCICSARSNSQLFKRFSRTLISNIKNNVDQLYFFTSLTASTRLQTSIGLPNNPGIFLIVGLTFLDEKYKQAYQRCDIQFCFLQFKEGQMYDLLCYTQQPLTPQRQCSSNSFAHFGQHWIKTTTFNQFIKLFKIALFNNKQRDFNHDLKNCKPKSTFIMKIRSKLYNEQNQLLREHETMLIDFEPNCSKDSSQNAKEKSSSKSLLDIILIQMNNSNPDRKKIHYHMVQQNELLLLIKKYLISNNTDESAHFSKKQQKENEVKMGGHITFINCIPANKETFLTHFTHLQYINSMIDQNWEAKVTRKRRQVKAFNHNYVQNQLKTIAQGIGLSTYPSLRNFNKFKQQFVSQAKRSIALIKQFRKGINSSIKQKLQLIFLKNELIAYEVKLIGSCIKSDHFKDFYHAKSYLQLQREVQIKTQQIKQSISGKLAALQELQKRFFILKNKEIQNYQKFKVNKQNPSILPNFQLTMMNWSNTTSLQQTRMGWNGDRTSQGKFKKMNLASVTVNPYELQKQLVNYLNQYMFSLWDGCILFDSRTVTNSIESEDQMLSEESRLFDMVNTFINEVTQIKDTEIMYQQENNVYNNNEVALFRSLNFLGLLGPKKLLKGYEIGKRIMIHGDCKKFELKNKQYNKKESKLPEINKKNPIIITGNLSINEMLTYPVVKTDIKLSQIVS